MSLYRCAACGSPNVVTDTQTGGIKYNYLKGAIGTVALGVGGAAAGITSDKQTVYKCPDCGITLTYSMGLEMKTMIDLGVASVEAREKLPVRWDVLKQQYKNIESGSADASIEQDKRLLAEVGSKTINQEEFDAAYDLMYDMERRLGYTRGRFDTPYDDEFSPDAPMKLADFLNWKAAIKTVIENLGKFLPAPLPAVGGKYRGKDTDRIAGWFFAYMAFEIEAETGEPVLFCKREMPKFEEYLKTNYFAEIFIETYKTHYIFNEYESSNAGKSVINMVRRGGKYINSNLFHRYSKFDEDTYTIMALPLFTIKNGKLGFWDLSYGQYTFSKNWLDFKTVIDNYFGYYPEKRESFEQEKKKREEIRKDSLQRKEQIDAINKEETQLNSKISEYNQKIAQLHSKFFAGKKTKQAIAELTEQVSECKKELSNLTAKRVSLSTEAAKPESDVDFYWRMMDKYDNFIPWRWVD